MARPAEIDWDSLDKTKFFTVGTGLFTGVTMALFPFSVIKTRLQIENATAASAAAPITLTPSPPQPSASSPPATSSSIPPLPHHSASSIKSPSPSSSSPSSATSAARRTGSWSGLSSGPGRPATMAQVVRTIARNEGIPGFYRGFTTVVAGMLPVRVLYMTSLEVGKKVTVTAIQAAGGPHTLGLTDAGAAGLASGVGGLCASLSSQAVVVPVDVISSRLMAQAADQQQQQKGSAAAFPRYKGGLDAFRQILKSEGVRGLYRGFGMSIMTYAPNSFTWWSTYGAVQRAFWNSYYAPPQKAAVQPLHIEDAKDRPLQRQELQERTHHARQQPLQQSDPQKPSLPVTVVDATLFAASPATTTISASSSSSSNSSSDSHRKLTASAPAAAAEPPPLWLVLSVQAVGGTVAGVVAAVVTTPMDTVKTRLQVERSSGERATVAAVVRRLMAEGGGSVLVFYRGLIPRSISMALWGTCMVSAYEFLKRICVKDDVQHGGLVPPQ